MNPRILCGDCTEELTELDDNSVDLIASDPPFALTSVDPKKATKDQGKQQKGFMGRVWDREVPSVAVWQECLRVLKPGAFMFVMSGPRQDCLAEMIRRIGKADFVIGFSSVYWAYSSGFPKSANVSKILDKRAGAKRKVIGKNPNHRPVSGVNYEGVYQGGNTGAPDITAPATPEAKRFEGSFTGLNLKPALEVILCVMKPLSEKTYVDQAMSNGKGVTWLDDGRIPTGENLDGGAYTKGRAPRAMNPNGLGDRNVSDCGDYVQPKGRFPANLLTSGDPFRSFESESPKTYVRKAKGFNDAVYGKGIGEEAGKESLNFGDSGSFSRYFDLDKWFEHKLRDLPEQVQHTFPFLITPKPSKREKNLGLDVDAERTTVSDGRKKSIDNPFQRGKTKRLNNHPTVKPIKLFSWLITLGSREGDLVLDPFVGSGTSGIAATMLGRNFIGIEMDPEFAAMAEQRIKMYALPEHKRIEAERQKFKRLFKKRKGKRKRRRIRVRR